MFDLIARFENSYHNDYENADAHAVGSKDGLDAANELSKIFNIQPEDPITIWELVSEAWTWAMTQKAAAMEPATQEPGQRPTPASFNTYEDYEAFYDSSALVLSREKWLLLKTDPENWKSVEVRVVPADEPAAQEPGPPDYLNTEPDWEGPTPEEAAKLAGNEPWTQQQIDEYEAYWNDLKKGADDAAAQIEAEAAQEPAATEQERTEQELERLTFEEEDRAYWESLSESERKELMDKAYADTTLPTPHPKTEAKDEPAAQEPPAMKTTDLRSISPAEYQAWWDNASEQERDALEAAMVNDSRVPFIGDEWAWSFSGGRWSNSVPASAWDAADEEERLERLKDAAQEPAAQEQPTAMDGPFNSLAEFKAWESGLSQQERDAYSEDDLMWLQLGGTLQKPDATRPEDN